MKKILLTFFAFFFSLQGAVASASNSNDLNIFVNDYVQVPSVVYQYIFAWQHGNSQLVNALLTRDGGYSDYHPDNINKPLRDKPLADYIKQFNRAQFIVTGINIPDEGKATVFWKIRWPNDNVTISFRDELTLADRGRRIAHIDSVSAPAPAEIVDLITRFSLGWVHVNGQEVLDTMLPGAIYYDGLKPQGVSGQELADYVVEMGYISGGLQHDVSLAKDRKVHGYFSLYLKSNNWWLVDGMDIIEVKNGKIASVHGYNLRWPQ